MNHTLLFHVFYPRHREKHWRWILNVLLDEWLGMRCIFTPHDEKNILIVMRDKTLSINADFLCLAQENWLSLTSLPKIPLNNWSLPDILKISLNPYESVPVIFGNGSFFQDEEGNATLGLDVFGAAFFMLSRYDEIVLNKKDQHDRYPGVDSFAFHAEIINRPIIDEYVEILWKSINSVWPDSVRKLNGCSVVVSCDVDEPYERWIKNPIYLLKGIFGALIKRRSPFIALRRIKNFFASRSNNFYFDPNWNFDWYMDLCENYGHKAYFYFIATPGTTEVDAVYSLEEPRMLALLKNINKRGHVIGLHGSYKTYRNAELLLSEREKLRKACLKAGINQEINYSRQHFLRWRAEITPDCLDAAGFVEDSSGGYADLAGFRFGTAKKFTMWSWQRLDALNLKQAPLIMMEGSIISSKNMGYTLGPAALKLMNNMKYHSLKWNGDFVFLWHNSNLQSEKEREIFEKLLNQ